MSQETTNEGGSLEEFNNKLKPRTVMSYRFPNGRLAESVWLPEQELMGFCVQGEDTVGFYPELLIGADGNQVDDMQKATKWLVTLTSAQGLGFADLLRFASGVEEYGSPKALLEEVRAYIKKYVVLEEPFYDIAALYAVMTWVYDRFSAIPYLRVIGNYGTGKSRFLDVVGNISFRAILSGASITPAALYRTVDLIQGTLAYDEADLRYSDMSSDIVKVLNGGHRKGMSVIRMEGDNRNMKPRAFKVFGPKILGSRESYTDLALESRCLTQRLFPMKSVDAPVHLPENFDEETAILRNKLLAFRFEHHANIKEDEASLGELAFPRLKQSVLPITSLAKYIDEGMLPSVLAFLERYEQQLRKTESTDMLADVLLCILRLAEFDPRIEKGRLYMRNIAEAFNERFYDEYKDRETKTLDTKEGLLVVKGQEVSARRIGTLVDKLGLDKDRIGDGIYIDALKNKGRLQVLAERYGLDTIIEEERTTRANRAPLLRTTENDDYQTPTVVEVVDTNEKLY